MRILAFVTALFIALSGQSGFSSERGEVDFGDFTLSPLTHASFVLYAAGKTIYVDPVGEAALYSKYPEPDLILITHIHGDHLAPELVAAIKSDETRIIGAPTVVEKLGYGEAVSNGESKEFSNISIEAIPAYNTTPERENFHPKGRDNGYLLSYGKTRFYISGDTEGTPEMLALKDIDYALLCMNLPYTMDVEAAAKAVLTFKPKVVMPYHYRGKGGMSDISKFKELVEKGEGIEARLYDWYK
ncbi:MAG: MBL fold metallo-hydrolase [Deltaproteobacteria bacterium]|nr:MAG: MBL fold metallo-hydrolase [Deltaproteobacteria bacterium]